MKPAVLCVLVVFTAAVAFLAGRHSASTLAVVASPRQPPLLGAVSPRAPSPSGTVVEVIQVPSYTYLRLETTSGEIWAAVATNKLVKAGDRIALGNAMAMHGFTSPTLKRSFDTIYFAQLEPK